MSWVAIGPTGRKISYPSRKELRQAVRANPALRSAEYDTRLKRALSTGKFRTIQEASGHLGRQQKTMRNLPTVAEQRRAKMAAELRAEIRVSSQVFDKDRAEAGRLVDKMARLGAHKPAHLTKTGKVSKAWERWNQEADATQKQLDRLVPPSMTKEFSYNIGV